MNEIQTIILLNIDIEHILKDEINNIYNKFENKNNIEIIRWRSNNIEFKKPKNISIFRDALSYIKPYHKKLIIFTDYELEKIIFKNSKATPCKDLEIVINVIDDIGGSTGITYDFVIDNYPVEYVFFDNMNNRYSFKTNEKITTDTFIEALKDKKKYIELSLKLNSRTTKKNFSNIDFSLLENMVFKKNEHIPQKHQYLFSEFDLEYHIKELFSTNNVDLQKQRFLNLKGFTQIQDHESISRIENHKYITVEIRPNCTIIFH